MNTPVQKPNKPGIEPKPHTQAFWEAANSDKLLYQYCLDCEKPQFVPSSVCRKCHQKNLDWRESSGQGFVFTYSIIHRAPNAAFKDDTPYPIAMVDMAEGFRITANILNCPPERVYIGMPVRVVFETRDGSDYKIPQVEPAE